MESTQYWTVGEFARRSGVTVRTVQYYDQKHLLATSAKGPQNRRLYSKENELELQRILVLKFLGSTLADIRSILEAETGTVDVNGLEGLIDKQALLLGRELTRLMHRAVALRELKEQIVQGEEVDWGKIADAIDNEGVDDFVLRMEEKSESAGHGKRPGPRNARQRSAGKASLRYDGLDEDSDAEAPEHSRPALTPWHEIAAETIGLLASGVACDDPWALEVVGRYRALCIEEGEKHLLSEFIPFGRMQDRVGNGAFMERLRESVDEYAACVEKHLPDALDDEASEEPL